MLDVHNEQGSEAKDFLPREELIDNGVCPECGGELETRVENLGDQDCSKNVVRVFCKDCGEDILEQWDTKKDQPKNKGY